jgi:hypothetical protein
MNGFMKFNLRFYKLTNEHANQSKNSGNILLLQKLLATHQNLRSTAISKPF